jgi:hypothetical protein
MANRAFVKCLPVRFWTFQDFKDGDGPRPLIDLTYKPGQDAALKSDRRLAATGIGLGQEVLIQDLLDGPRADLGELLQV